MLTTSPLLASVVLDMTKSVESTPSDAITADGDLSRDSSELFDSCRVPLLWMLLFNLQPCETQ